MKLNEASMLQAGKYLLACLTGAIEDGMKAHYGENWFDMLKDYEAGQKIPILTDENSIKDFDIQACLKFFKFRSEFRDAVLSHFGFYDLGTEEEKRQSRNIFTETVTRLINDYRNQYMHLKASTVEQEDESKGTDDIFGAESILHDMKDVAKYFLRIKDTDGVPYYDRICECERSFEKDRRQKKISINEVLCLKGFQKFTENDFLRACGGLNIPVREDSTNGGFYFYSSEPEEDRKRIKKRLVLDREERDKAVKKKAVLTGMLVAAAAAVTAIIAGISATGKNEDRSTGSSVEVFSPGKYEISNGIGIEECENLMAELLDKSKGDYEGFKELFASSYKDNPKEQYIESNYKAPFMKNASTCRKHILVPVTEQDGELGLSGVYYDKGDDPAYSIARCYTLVRENGTLKIDLEKQDDISDYTEAYPEGYVKAKAEKRNTWINDKENFMFVSETAVYEGQKKVEPKLAWENEDGSLGLMIRISNGTEVTAQYSELYINLTLTGERILYEGNADIRFGGKPCRVEEGRGVNYVLNIKKGALHDTSGEEWFGFNAEVEAKEVL